MNPNLLHQKGLTLLGATLASFAVVNTLSLGSLSQIHRSPGEFMGQPLGQFHWQQLLEGDRAWAKKSGGRVRSGSFSKPSSSKSSGSNSSPSKSSSSSPSKSSSSSSSSNSSGNNSTPSHTTINNNSVYYGGSSYQNGSDVSSDSTGDGEALFWLLIFGLCVGGVVWWWWCSQQKTGASESADTEDRGSAELDNDIVNVSRLQLVLLSEARTIQAELNDLAEQIETETPEGTVELLRESVLSLMRHPEYWAYAQGTSQRATSREMAQRLFEQFSIEERSRFTSETLVKVGSGPLRQQNAAPEASASPDVGRYVVVTLLVGTEDDHPLFGEIHSIEDVKTVLATLAAVTPDYLLTVELLWTPQSEGRSLSEDELILEYPHLVSL